MANVIKVLLGILVCIAILFIGLGLIAPKEYSLSKSTVINAPKEVIFPHVKYFEKSAAWYPWNKKDPNMISSIEGTDGTVGAISKWSGNDEVGVGQQEITEIIENESRKTHLKFESPWPSEADTFFKLEDNYKGTKVTWGMSGTYGFIESAFMVFMDMNDLVGKEYKEGLASLKEIAEKEYAASRSAEVIK